jgi:L-lactate dehydrogenase complex protein LldE
MNKSALNVALFIPCLVDQVYPGIGLAMAKFLKHFGYQISYDPRQTCCGQPAFNAGHRAEARRVARTFLQVFEHADLIVGPSGSCTAMVRNYYPVLFKDEHDCETARALGPRILEFSEFCLRENLDKQISGNFPAAVGFHNSCHSYRELGIREAPFRLLERFAGIELKTPPGEPVCCGFGGLFSAKYNAIAAAMANTRLLSFTDLGVDYIVSNDPGCIMHMRQEAIDRGIGTPILHLTEFLVKAMKIS